jgi:hypothetical protein
LHTEEDTFAHRWYVCAQKRIPLLTEKETFARRKGYFCSQKNISLLTEDDTFAHRRYIFSQMIVYTENICAQRLFLQRKIPVHSERTCVHGSFPASGTPQTSELDANQLADSVLRATYH